MRARRDRWTRPSTLLAIALVVVSGVWVTVLVRAALHPALCGGGGGCPPPPPQAWQRLAGGGPPGTGPMAYDAASTDFVLFAHDPNAANCEASFSTWLLNSTDLTWARAATNLTPPPVFGSTMAFDPSTQEVVLFGGATCAGALTNQTWAFGSQGWSNVTRSVGPPPREDGGLAPVKDPPGLLLFGGFGGTDGAGQRLNDTWELQNETWTELDPQRSPVPRDLFGMGASPWNLNDTVELFGGLARCPGVPGYTSSCLVLSDTWRWNNGPRDWEPISGSAPTTVRYEMGFAGSWMGPFLFGGATVGSGSPLNDSWLEADNNWSTFSVPNAPPPRSGADVGVLGYSSILVYGGWDGSHELNDTWLLPPPPSVPVAQSDNVGTGGPKGPASLTNLGLAMSAGVTPTAWDPASGKRGRAFSRTVRPRPTGRRGRAASAGSSTATGRAR